jgi:hypothetical protein
VALRPRLATGVLVSMSRGQVDRPDGLSLGAVNGHYGEIIRVALDVGSAIGRTFRRPAIGSTSLVSRPSGGLAAGLELGSPDPPSTGTPSVSDGPEWSRRHVCTRS